MLVKSPAVDLAEAGAAGSGAFGGSTGGESEDCPPPNNWVNSPPEDDDSAAGGGAEGGGDFFCSWKNSCVNSPDFTGLSDCTLGGEAGTGEGAAGAEGVDFLTGSSEAPKTSVNPPPEGEDGGATGGSSAGCGAGGGGSAASWPALPNISVKPPLLAAGSGGSALGSDLATGSGSAGGTGFPADEPKMSVNPSAEDEDSAVGGGLGSRRRSGAAGLPAEAVPDSERASPPESRRYR